MNRKKTRIYISGPITGTEDYLKRFKEAEEKLKKQMPKADFINPAGVMAGLPESTTWKEYMDIAIRLLDMCDGIYMLENWKDSTGASIEYGYAMAMDKFILNE